MTPADCHTPVRYAGEALVGGLLEALWGVRVKGLEHVPPEGPLILAGNHLNVLDGNVLGWAVHAVRRPRFLAKAELFREPFLRWLFTSTGCIPLDRTGDVTAAMRAAIAALRAGSALVLFPEGRRRKPGEGPLPPKSGVGFLAATAPAPVLPARILGMDRFPWVRPIEVRLGRPLPPPPPGKDAARDFARAVMDAVYAL